MKKKVNTIYIHIIGWSIVAVFGLLQEFLNTSFGLFSKGIMLSLKISPFEISQISTVFFAVYALMQLPAGIFLDRYSPRHVLTIATLLTSTGILLFALALNKNMLIIGCLLMSIGSSFAFVGGVFLTMWWFSPYRFALMVGLLDAIAFIGTGVVDQIFSVLLKYLNWERILITVSIISFLLSFLVWTIVHDESSTVNKMQSKKDIISFSHIFKIISNSQVLLCLVYNGLLFGTMIAFSSFWNFLYQDINHWSLEFATLANGIILIGVSTGAPFAGWLSNYINLRRLPMQVFAVGAFVSIFMILYCPMSPLYICFSMFFFGFFCSSHPLGYAVGRENTLKEEGATMVGFMNMFTFMVIALLQFLPGLLLKLLKDNEVLKIIDQLNIYYTVYAIFPICILIGLCSTFFIKETHCILKDS